ncbi:hypothetical protein DTO207G8_7973 [Paecilomyces variotii]|nr:hypothetical protein DTO207G8_7973 [Paecilomyces variotii]KAJ9375161.1 hypothetical protein DTO282E5_145 [Paecilomyces variotii]
MSTSTLYTLALTLPLVLIFWTLSSTSGSPFGSSFPRLYNKRICLLIAHPDDEAMFFAPALLALTKPALGNHVKILCLSTGDADGLGHIRQKELQKSALHLGLRSESDVFIVDNPAQFPDSMSKTWSENDIASLLASAFAPNISSSTPSANGSSSSRRKQNTSDNDAPFATIDVLITFDKHGISNHPNHRSLYYGALAFLRTLMKGKTGYSCPVTLYTLSTTNIVRKYAGVLDAPVTMLVGALSNLRSALGGSRSGKSRPSTSGGATAPERLLFVSNVNEWLRAQGSMVKAHKSQMVWFRWGWITIGRYMVVNDLRKEKI